MCQGRGVLPYHQDVCEARGNVQAALAAGGALAASCLHPSAGMDHAEYLFQAWGLRPGLPGVLRRVCSQGLPLYVSPRGRDWQKWWKLRHLRHGLRGLLRWLQGEGLPVHLRHPVAYWKQCIPPWLPGRALHTQQKKLGTCTTHVDPQSTLPRRGAERKCEMVVSILV